MWRALTWLNLYGCEAVRHKRKNSLKNTKNPFFACFWAHVGQPHNHIGWATSMPFASINPTHLRTNLKIFMKKYWELAKPWKWLLFSFWFFGFWLLGCSNFFFFFSQWKTPRRFIWGSVYFCTMDGFFKILKKAVSELICTRLYLCLHWLTFGLPPTYLSTLTCHNFFPYIDM